MRTSDELLQDLDFLADRLSERTGENVSYKYDWLQDRIFLSIGHHSFTGYDVYRKSETLQRYIDNWYNHYEEVVSVAGY